ncbi:MAG: tRNA lysidine(34) synthetase TilS, partial [Verrucomicrobiae bacterium]|nr:tRNA lysidine(34) synthetase TilS [Verrucomicrobiae bacterium]
MDDRPDIPWLRDAPRRAKWLVGVSGGADSVALLHLLHDAGFRKLIVCHLDHRLRGAASTADARFVGKLAARLGYRCETGRDDVRQHMKSEGLSLETAAREARHRFFAACATKHRCPRVLLAHHADDQAETVLWNLLRGSDGLRGMSETQEIRIGRKTLTFVRPLLGIRRDDLRRFLTGNGHRWREDASNAMPVAVRNRLRNEVLPLLADISGRDPVPPLVRAAADAADLRDETSAALDSLRLLDPQGRLHLPTLRELPPRLQRAAIHRFLAERNIPGLSRARIDEALHLL